MEINNKNILLLNKVDNMEDCEYMKVTNGNERNVENKKKIQWKPFLRQLLVCSGGWSSMFIYGMCVGSPTVIVPQLRKEANSIDAITDEMASWLSSAMFFSGIPLIVVAGITSKLIGKKITFIAGSLSLLIGFIIFYISSNVTHLLIGLVIQGLFSAVQIVTLNMILTEYTSPIYRGIFLLSSVATLYCGVWAANAIGTFCHWKNIPLLGIIIAVYVILTALIWPESPYWLASKGKFEECETAHRWLKGFDEESERELESLINSQKECITQVTVTSVNNWIKKFWNTIRSKEFYKPTLIAIATFSLTVFCGKTVCIVYAIDILKQITKSETTAYIGMLILDGVTVFSMYLGCIVARYVRRRRIILISSSISVGFLFILSFYLYIIKKDFISENKYVSIVLLTAFSIAVGCGPMIMGHSFYGELLPLKSRYLSFCLTSLVVKILASSFLKNAPLMLKTFGPHGFFLFYGVCMSIVVLVTYKYLPETKDKTIQEITDSMKGKPNKLEGLGKLLVNVNNG